MRALWMGVLSLGCASPSAMPMMDCAAILDGAARIHCAKGRFLMCARVDGLVTRDLQWITHDGADVVLEQRDGAQRVLVSMASDVSTDAVQNETLTLVVLPEERARLVVYSRPTQTTLTGCSAQPASTVEMGDQQIVFQLEAVGDAVIGGGCRARPDITQMIGCASVE